MATTQFVIADNVNTQLAAALPSSGAGSTTVTLASSANLPTLSAGQVMPLTLNDAATGAIYEIVYVTAITGVTLTVTRAQEGTTAQNWNIGDFAFCAPTSGTVAMINGSPSNQFFVAPATASQHAVQKAQLGSLPGKASFNTGSQTLTLSQLGFLIELFGASSTFTLPSAATIPVGSCYYFVNDGPGVLTIAVAGGSDFIYIAGTSLTSISIPSGGTLTLTGNASTEIDVSGGSAALQYSPLSVPMPVVGSVRNLVMSVTAASATATLTADEITVETALGGFGYKLANFNKTINLATTGAGGMDTGTAPVSGYVALYAIYNPTTSTAALLATNATSAVQPNVYGGANMPSGYTASALISVVPTNASRLFLPCLQMDRYVAVGGAQVITTSVAQASVTSINISTAVPPNARFVSGAQQVQTSAASVVTGALYPSATGFSPVFTYLNSQASAGGSINVPFSRMPILTAQTMYYTVTISAGTLSYVVYVGGYEF